MARLASQPSVLLVLVALFPTAARPDDRPVVPALIVGADPPVPFIVQGMMRTPEGSIGFYVISDGRRQLCAIYDAADGVPFILSDDQQTLLYDLRNERIIHVPRCRGFLRILWNAGEAKPLAFQFSYQTKANLEELQECTCWIRIDQFVDALADKLVREESEPGVERYTVERLEGGTETLEVNTTGEGFRFTSKRPEESYVGLELEAQSIGQPVPEDLLALPDIDRLSGELQLLTAEMETFPDLYRFLKGGQAVMAKYALAGGSELQTIVGTTMPFADWSALRERDRSFGARYRAALSQQGFALRLDPPRELE
ncbi:MAG: hypothetical protein KF861_11100 [Planctomycetaceae bacterium]|nr:hypothetical protein [Planctomycetaceae bacterium]